MAGNKHFYVRLTLPGEKMPRVGVFAKTPEDAAKLALECVGVEVDDDKGRTLFIVCEPDYEEEAR